MRNRPCRDRADHLGGPAAHPIGDDEPRPGSTPCGRRRTRTRRQRSTRSGATVGVVGEFAVRGIELEVGRRHVDAEPVPQLVGDPHPTEITRRENQDASPAARQLFNPGDEGASAELQAESASPGVGWSSSVRAAGRTRGADRPIGFSIEAVCLAHEIDEGRRRVALHRIVRTEVAAAAIPTDVELRQGHDAVVVRMEDGDVRIGSR